MSSSIKKNGEIDILTNYHVIENAKTLTCTLADNTNVEATVKGVDEDRDLAVISIKTKRFKFGYFKTNCDCDNWRQRQTTSR